MRPPDRGGPAIEAEILAGAGGATWRGLARETAPLLAINDNHPKTIITLDRVHGDSIAGIRVASLTDFLSEH